MVKSFRKISKKNLMMMQANKISTAFEEEAEEILKDTEDAIKENFPSRSLRSCLTTASKKLADEGISARFDYKISREQLRKTAEIEATSDEVEEALEAIIKATVEEIEDLLKDTDEYADEVVEKETDDEVDACAMEDELKCNIESKLRNMGINCRLARKYTRPAKKTSRKTASAGTKRPTKRVNPILARMTK